MYQNSFHKNDPVQIAELTKLVSSFHGFQPIFFPNVAIDLGLFVI